MVYFSRAPGTRKLLSAASGAGWFGGGEEKSFSNIQVVPHPVCSSTSRWGKHSFFRPTKEMGCYLLATESGMSRGAQMVYCPSPERNRSLPSGCAATHLFYYVGISSRSFCPTKEVVLVSRDTRDPLAKGRHQA